LKRKKIKIKGAMKKPKMFTAQIQY